MRTDELIKTLAEDAAPPPPIWRATSIALLLGVAASLILFFAFLGVRPKLIAAASNWQFQLKMAVFGGMVFSAAIDFFRLMRPGAWQFPVGLIGAAAILAGSAVFALTVVPSERWYVHLFAGDWQTCLAAVPLLAIAPLIAAIAAMRAAAPASPSMAGLAAGGLAVTISAAIYATHCRADTPIFYAAWYSLGGMSILLSGALAGRFALRW